MVNLAINDAMLRQKHAYGEHRKPNLEEICRVNEISRPEWTPSPFIPQ
jgi:hypothetical protein